MRAFLILSALVNAALATQQAPGTFKNKRVPLRGVAQASSRGRTSTLSLRSNSTIPPLDAQRRRRWKFVPGGNTVFP